MTKEELEREARKLGFVLMPFDPETERTITKRFRVSPKEDDLLSAKAEANGETQSQYIRRKLFYE
jgi:hypothetical protein